MSDDEGRAELTEALGRIVDAGTERDSRELHDICRRLRSLVRSSEAWGMRLEILADGRLRADLFDGSGYSMVCGEVAGDTHEENSVPIDLLELKRRAAEHVERERPKLAPREQRLATALCGPHDRKAAKPAKKQPKGDR